MNHAQPVILDRREAEALAVKLTRGAEKPTDEQEEALDHLFGRVVAYLGKLRAEQEA